MTTVRQHPVLQNRVPFSSLLDGFLQDTVSNRRASGFTPAVDLWETDHNYQFQMALPGVQKENINVEFQDGVLTVSGERAFQKEEKEQKFHRVENLYGKFKRSFQLPEHVDGAAIEAHYENGVLHITVPKIEEKVLKHHIAVK